MSRITFDWVWTQWVVGIAWCKYDTFICLGPLTINYEREQLWGRITRKERP